MKHYITQTGSGEVISGEKGYQLRLPPVDAGAYHNAQIASYIARQDMDHTPPLRLSLRAWAEGGLHGTAGFGFWNHPYDPSAGLFGRFRLPRALWFFHSTPPNHMPLALDVPGHGWKCATFNAANRRFLSLLPFAPFGFLLMHFPALYRHWWPVGQDALGVSESALRPEMLATPHEYTLEWHREHVVFGVDGRTVHMARHRLHGPLGFIAWVDNQYAVVTPQGRFGSGLLSAAGPQALHIEDLYLKPL